MGLIFLASSDRMSFQHSIQIVGPIVRWLFPRLSAEAVRSVVLGVRKSAHVTEYMILALLLWRALQKPGTHPPSWQWRVAAHSALLAILYAGSDELHQLFVASRQASVVDVLIDTSGAVLGLLFLWGIGRWRKRW
jgi:VanZ family protein